MRLRRKLMVEMEEFMRSVDVLVNANDLFITNLTGHPSVVLPRKFRERNGWKSPVSDVFTGQLFGETELLQLSLAYQNLVDGHLQKPDLNANIQKMNDEEAAKKSAEKDGKDDKKKQDQEKDN